LKIAIVSKGRFHVLDLARELNALGHEVTFYSYVPKKRVEKFGLSRKCCNSTLLYVLAPLIFVAKKGWSKSFRGWANRQLTKAIDFWMRFLLKECDIFISMSGLCIESALFARKRFGAKIIYERGSRHILSQKQILDALGIGAGTKVPQFDVDRELQSYELADYIAIPSEHVEESFDEFARELKQKMFRNPYGICLDMFTPVPAEKKYDVIMAGTWGLQKGCDTLSETCHKFGFSLAHAGGIGDLEFPKKEWAKDFGFIDQALLKNYYAQAKIFALASVQEGLALVQAQALSCGLPLVCTDRTGGADIKKLLGDPEYIYVVPHGDVNALGEAIRNALAYADAHQGEDLLGERRELLSWSAYGKRYGQFLNSVFKG
jgi:glycosyltransferase involved in cell wall biosynthesis